LCSGLLRAERVLRSGLRKRLRLEGLLRRPDGLVQEASPRWVLREERLLRSGSQLLRPGL
jgi:hypothetical protein